MIRPGSEPAPDPLLRLAGAVVKHARRRVGMTREELARETGYAYDTISSLELGRRRPMAQFLHAADSVLDAGGLLRLLVEHVQHRAGASGTVGGLGAAEAEAEALGYYAPCVMPVLLRTPTYAAALHPPREDPEATARRTVLGREVPITFILDETVLHRPIGGREVLRAQLLALTDLADRPHVTVQVMPWDTREHAGLTSATAILRLDGRWCACVDNGVDVQWATSHSAERLAHAYGALRAQALSPCASVDLIAKTAADL